MKQKKPKTEEFANEQDLDPRAAADEPAVSVPEPVRRQPTLIERVSVMHALASAAQNLELKSTFLSLDGGQRAHDLFVQAIEAELADLMGGSKEEELAVSLADASRDAMGALGAVREVLGGLSQMIKRMQGAAPVQQTTGYSQQQQQPTSHEVVSAPRGDMIVGLST